MKAVYHYLQYKYDKPSVPVHVPCEVVGETAKRYKIRLLANNVRGHRYGDIIGVNKDSVTLPREVEDCSGAWWNN